jgi:Tetratricopeptide Repeats-Sensor
MSLLRGRSEELKSFLKDADADRREIVEENYGLLGSTEKRIAELCYEVGCHCGGGRWSSDMQAALENSRHWYEQGFRRSVSSHWTGVQFMSLETVLTGKISDPTGWYACAYAARMMAASPEEIWAWGSIAELHLLAPAAGTDGKLEQALEALSEMKQRVGDGDRFPLETTKRQFQRYVSWWTKENGFFPNGADLAQHAQILVQALR